MANKVEEETYSLNLEEEKKEILKRYRKLLRACKRTTGVVDKKLIRKAFDLALDAHKEMRRKSGEPYIFHPIEVATICAEEMGLGTTSVVCALLHDTVEDTYVTLEDIYEQFGGKVAKIIDGLTKIPGAGDITDANSSVQAENYRKLILSIAHDLRVIFIKLADRLHNMRTMEFMPRHKQLKISYETLAIYGPLAHRMGLNNVKTELEDLGFKYTEPELYAEIEQRVRTSQRERTRFINKFSLPVINVLTDRGFQFDIKGRPKSIYSIGQKISNKGVSFEEVYDIFAIRIILDTPMDQEKADCWRVYSVVTDFYTPRPDRLRDWISTPKSNGYESLHTTVMGPNGKWVEVQIRSKRMDDIAEKGFAAHWKYKGGEDSEEQIIGEGQQLDDWVKQISFMLENPAPNALDFLDDLKLHLYSDEIFVFTPKGDIRTLPTNATLLDFAYEIHTQLGNRCTGGKVNQKLVPINYVLKSGEQVEILTSRKQKPRKDWVNSVITGKAKAQIKIALKKERKKVFDEGKEILLRKLTQNGVKEFSEVINEMVDYFNVEEVSDLYFHVVTGDINNQKIKSFLAQREEVTRKSSPAVPAPTKMPDRKSELVIGDTDAQLGYKFAKCCNAIPGDEIFGFVTVGEGVKVHKSTCPNAKELLSQYAYRVIKARWADQEMIEFLAGVAVTGIDDLGLIHKITECISTEQGLNIKSLSFDAHDGLFEGRIGLFVKDTSHLASLMDRLKRIDGIKNVTRED